MINENIQYIASSSNETASFKSILLIDDDMDLCMLMKDYFARHGFRIESAHDGHKGLELAFEKNFDLIILDMMLPVLEGFEVLRQIRKRSTVPVICLLRARRKRTALSGLGFGSR